MPFGAGRKEKVDVRTVLALSLCDGADGSGDLNNRSYSRRLETESGAYAGRRDEAEGVTLSGDLCVGIESP